jgi:hypothetical protein
MNRISFGLVENEFFREPVESMIVDGEPLADLIGRSAPRSGYTNLVSALLPPSDTFLTPAEAARIRSTILPPEGGVEVAPVLICPDDLDLSCSVIVVQIERIAGSVIWRQVGVELGKLVELHGGMQTPTVEWWQGVGPFSFSLAEYEACLAAFESAATQKPEAMARGSEL